MVLNHQIGVRFPVPLPTFAHACPRSVSYGWQATRRLSTVARSAKVDVPAVADFARHLRDNGSCQFCVTFRRIIETRSVCTCEQLAGRSARYAAQRSVI